MTITSLNENNKSQLCCFVFYKYQDKISYERIFTFLKENYNFIPDIIHTDYEYSLYTVFDNKNIFNKKIIHVFCFFHYIKAIKEKLIKLKVTKRRLNRISYEIIKNIEILSFLNNDILNKYIKFIIDKILSLDNIKNINKFIKYLKDNWFSKNTNLNK